MRGGAEGYRIDVYPGKLDPAEFEDRVRSAAPGRRARGEAVALRWTHGSEPVLGGVTDELRAAVVPGLVERRLSALFSWVDAELRLGHHEELLPELRALTAEHPLRTGAQAPERRRERRGNCSRRWPPYTAVRGTTGRPSRCWRPR
ncbi:BTAD domain-containing putative transcriptional regulator [Actinosynnema sp. NPDC059797]